MKSSASIFKFIFDFFKSFSSTCDQKSEISLDIILLNHSLRQNFFSTKNISGFNKLFFL